VSRRNGSARSVLIIKSQHEDARIEELKRLGMQRILDSYPADPGELITGAWARLLGDDDDGIRESHGDLTESRRRSIRGKRRRQPIDPYLGRGRDHDS
jgi:hypothetical protein